VGERARDGRTGGSRARAGRDRERLSPRRGVRINPSFSIAEHAQVLDAARRAGLTPTGFVAQAALAVACGEAGAVPVSSAEYEALRDVQAMLFDACTSVNRVGNNLNQAVTVLRSTSEAPQWLERVAAMCARSLATLDEAVSAVHRRIR
jgi:hypothetical protein